MKQSTYALKLAGAAVLAGSTQAYGQIVALTLPANLVLPPASPDPNDATQLDSRASENYIVQPSSSIANDFNFGAFFGEPSYFNTNIYPLKAGNGIAVTPANGYFYATALSVGTKIGSDTLTFDTATQTASLTPPGPYIYPPLVILAGTTDGVTIGNDQPVNTVEYVGFQFVDGLNNVHDGWLELNSTFSGDPTNPGGLTFIAGAYNSVADTGNGAGDILVGEVPEPGTISSLVLGAAALVGVGLMRRRRAGLGAA